MDDRGGPALDPAILAHYNRRPEETRLERGLSQLEAVRTRSLLERHGHFALSASSSAKAASHVLAARIFARAIALHRGANA